MSAEHKIRMRIRELLALRQPGSIIRRPDIHAPGHLEPASKGGFFPLAVPLLAAAAPVLGSVANWAFKKITGSGVKPKRTRKPTAYNLFCKEFHKHWVQGSKPSTQFLKDAAAEWRRMKAAKHPAVDVEYWTASPSQKKDQARKKKLASPKLPKTRAPKHRLLA